MKTQRATDGGCFSAVLMQRQKLLQPRTVAAVRACRNKRAANARTFYLSLSLRFDTRARSLCVYNAEISFAGRAAA